MDDKLKNFYFNLQLQFLLKDCHKLISETIEEDMELYSWNFDERQGMLNDIDGAMAIINDEMPKFTVKKERHLRLVPNVRENSKE
jgi:hypothetical protein